ncbi:hypothetical protein P2H44_24065 [Albimonas sp. CAU 1670]|uniref:hypothetical protein n=1 Tax=Albimonas sp. CAU 1670 TaxID=3032599 RepID=UPI0023DB00D7|nr:hypothetical protein [Albimonas sp. CAU 1670]MDF2235645.1 hypothetical protein [Albimonas sp. CAU 1670]
MKRFKTKTAAWGAALAGAAAVGTVPASVAAHPGHGAAWDHLHGPETLLWIGLVAALTVSIALLARGR